MVAVTKHIGKMEGSGTRVAIVFRQIPEDKDHALVVSTDNLPDLYHDAFINLIDSPEGQEVNELQEILNRRQFPDGTNMLKQLHAGGHLVKVSNDQVNVMPRPGQSIKLHQLNAEIEKISPGTTLASNPTPEKRADPTKTEARNLLAQADVLDDQAKSIRENAYAMDPDIRPKRGRPVGSTAKKD